MLSRIGRSYRNFFKSGIYWLSGGILIGFRSWGYATWWWPALFTAFFVLLIPALWALI